MSAIFGEKVSLAQRNGPEVELVVYGDEYYARYETTQGYSAVRDEALGFFTYARLVDGAFVSTGVAVTSPPPSDAVMNGKESDDVRLAKRGAARERKFPGEGR